MPAAEALEPVSIRLGTRSYEIRFDRLAVAADHIASIGLTPGRCVVITDANVEPLYGNALITSLHDGGWAPSKITLPPGETTKSIEHLSHIYDAALSNGIDRQTPVLAMGGGVVGDLAGFAAATLLRGIPLVHLPTTLIAQVDSAIGGKTGINHASGKNLVGAFYQPRLILVDATALGSLPEREWFSGLAEVVKHALIASPGFFSSLETHWEGILQRDQDLVPTLVRTAATIKARVVEQDERESGLRAILNFGHTFAHAIERVAGYGRFTHGEAVVHGMRAALHLSRSLHPGLDFNRAVRLVSQIPTAGRSGDLSLYQLMDAMRVDKKSARGRLRFVVLEEIGKARVTEVDDLSIVEAAWRFALAQ